MAVFPAQTGAAADYKIPFPGILFNSKTPEKKEITAQIPDSAGLKMPGKRWMSKKRGENNPEKIEKNAGGKYIKP